MYKVASFFAGVGGIDIGFEQTGSCRTVYANELDPYAANTYEMNFPIKVDVRDINEVKAEEIPSIDIMVGGFPCQPFSNAGLKQGFDDEKGRGNLFFELIRIMKVKRPKAILFENVSNLSSHDEGRTLSVILHEFLKIGYQAGYRVLNAMEYGNIPQTRKRIYFVAFDSVECFNRFRWPKPVPLVKSIKDVIDFNSRVDEEYYYRPGKFKGDIYNQLVSSTLHENPDNPSVYQWRRYYVRKNKSGVIPALTANQGGGGHNVSLIKTYYGIRKMTPRECFNAQGFPTSFRLPAQSDSRLYKQAGNSVCVPVIKRIANRIVQALDNSTSARR